MVYITLLFTLFSHQCYTCIYFSTPPRDSRKGGEQKKEFYIHKIYWNKIFRTVNRTTKNRNKTNGRKYFSFSLLLLLLLHPLFFLCCVCFFFEPQCVEEQKICNIIIILHISSIYESRDQHPLMYMYRYILVMGHSTFFFSE